MRVTFWGVRGSIPTPGPDTVGVGGNTTCLEIRAGKALVIFDAGTGLRVLGNRLLAELPIEAHLFFSHVHWDHIQGFPFFAPAFIPGNVIHLYGGNNVSRTLEETLAGQMDYPSFPVTLGQLGATMSFHGIVEGKVYTLDAGDGTTLTVRAAAGYHPNGVWAFRIEHEGRSVVFATDTENEESPHSAIAALARDCDVLIHDAQYTPDEYAGTAGHGGPKHGWGHSTYPYAVEVAKAARAKQLVLFHHDPLQSDAEVAAKEAAARALFPSCIAAREGLTLEL